MRDASWMADAACADPQVEAEWFFPEDPRSRAYSIAAQICASCPVRAQCAAYADAEGFAAGVWAGRLRQERPGAASARAAPVPTVGSIRRMRALATLGHSSTAVAAQIRRGRGQGTVSASHLGQMRAGNFAFTSEAVHEAVRAAYADLGRRECDAHGGAAGRRRASLAGWASPAAWAGLDIDDPNAIPARSERESA